MKTIKTLKTHEEAIEFFESIPDNLWTTGAFTKRVGNTECHCMYGHCGVNSDNYVENENGEAFILSKTGLPKLLKPFLTKEYVSSEFWLSSINDAEHVSEQFYELGDTPKERVINALTLAGSGIMEDL